MVEELSLFCFITAIYFGASLSIRRRKSLRMTAIMELVPERWKNLVLMFNDCAFLVLTGLIAFLSTDMMEAQIRLPQDVYKRQVPAERRSSRAQTRPCARFPHEWHGRPDPCRHPFHR